jgi:hypothetical protein
MEELDYLGIFRGLNKKKIRYVVCGGVAVNLWGIPRMTYDIDLLLDMREANLKKFLALLQEWEFKPKIPADITDLLDEKKRNIWIEEKNMKAFSLHNPGWAISEIDVLVGVSPGYDKVVERVVYKSVGNVKIPLISPEDLIATKQNTGRRQDEADIEHLTRLKRQFHGKDGI